MSKRIFGALNNLLDSGCRRLKYKEQQRLCDWHFFQVEMQHRTNESLLSSG